MKIVILGAGALGTVLGAHCVRAGEDVTLIARGQRAAYLQEHGATITVERGKRLEVKETLGYAVQQGAALGLPTPTMAVCYKLIAGLNHYLQ